MQFLCRDCWRCFQGLVELWGSQPISRWFDPFLSVLVLESFFEGVLSVSACTRCFYLDLLVFFFFVIFSHPSIVFLLFVVDESASLTQATVQTLDRDL
uniref:Uncharacterized protein n=1 Tax=Physcomitrium patens TaxID=3218 RepID=A0A2K1JL54_PHYPA|nr:hypothetical protein PHYPA_016935 [Physcomitrium patens]